MLLWVMSDRAIPRSFRFMEGFGVHTFRFVNADGRSTFVKFHWKPKQGMQSVLWDEAVKINGADPDFHRRDLWDAITEGDPAGLGALRPDRSTTPSPTEFEFDVLDPTKLIPEEVLPAAPIGRLVLDRVVDNFFAETEQVAFCTQNVVPGIDFTNDPLLQGRNFSYLDTQLKRLGIPNFTHIPVNAPKCPIAHFQQDGHMAMTNPVGRINYEPNSAPSEPARARVRIPTGGSRPSRPRTPARSGGCGRSRSPTTTARPCSSTGARPRSSSSTSPTPSPSSWPRSTTRPSASAWSPTCATSTRSLARTDRRRPRPVALPAAAEPAVPPVADLPPSPALSILLNGPDSFAGRKVGVLVSRRRQRQGRSRPCVAAVTAEGALVELIAPAIGGVDPRRRLHASPPTRWSAAARRCSTTPSPSSPARGRRGARRAPGGQGLRQRRPRPRQVHRPHRRCRAPARRRRRRRRHGRRLPPARHPGDGDRFIQACRSLRHWDRAMAEPL